MWGPVDLAPAKNNVLAFECEPGSPGAIFQRFKPETPEIEDSPFSQQSLEGGALLESPEAAAFAQYQDGQNVRIYITDKNGTRTEFVIQPDEPFEERWGQAFEQADFDCSRMNVLDNARLKAFEMQQILTERGDVEFESVAQLYKFMKCHMNFDQYNADDTYWAAKEYLEQLQDCIALCAGERKVILASATKFLDDCLVNGPESLRNMLVLIMEGDDDILLPNWMQVMTPEIRRDMNQAQSDMELVFGVKWEAISDVKSLQEHLSQFESNNQLDALGLFIRALPPEAKNPALREILVDILKKGRVDDDLQRLWNVGKLASERLAMMVDYDSVTGRSS